MKFKEKEPGWWKTYLSEDKNLIRPFDGYEYPLTYTFLIATDIFSTFTIDEFISKGEKNLPNNDIFNLKVKFIENHPFWYKHKLSLIKNITVLEKTEKDIDYLAYISKEKPSECPKNYCLKEDETIKYTYKFILTHLKDNKTVLSMYVMHALCDGRTLFNLFDDVRKVIEMILNKSDESIILPKKDVKICDFGQFNNYVNLTEDLYKEPPKTWSQVPFISILPKLDEEDKKKKVFYINQHFIYDYKPIKKFCDENKVSIQSMLTTMIARSIRKFNKFPLETPIYNYTPCDSRSSPHATEYLKNRQYFCGAGALFPCSIGQKDLLADIQYNYKKLKEAISGKGNISQILRSSMTIDKETLKYNPENKLPDFNKQACSIASHIGKVNGNIPLIGICSDLGEDYDNYLIAFDAVHNEEKFTINLLKPNFFKKEFMDIIKKEMDLIFLIN